MSCVLFLPYRRSHFFCWQEFPPPMPRPTKRRKIEELPKAVFALVLYHLMFGSLFWAGGFRG